MLDLTSLVGNEPLKRQLAAIRTGDQLSHAYLITGAPGSGRDTLARLLAAAMQCEGGARIPCGQCAACRKMQKKIHPDVIEADGGVTAKQVEWVRALRQDAYIRPNEGRRKIYLIRHAEQLSADSQNILLKLLEDGPETCAFFLMAENAAAVLQTVRSRCIELSTAPLTHEQCRQVVRAALPDADPAEVEQAVCRCEGSAGAAIELLTGGGAADAGLAVEYAQLLAGRQEEALNRFAAALELSKPDRAKLDGFLDGLLLLLRDGLMASLLPSGVEDTADAAAATALAKNLTRAQLVAMTDLIRQLKLAGRHNLSAGATAGWLAVESWRILNE